MCRPPSNQPSVCTSSSESESGLENTDNQQGSESVSSSQNTDSQQQSGPARKKRSPGEVETVTKVDNEGNARFVKLMMSIDEATRISLGHSFGQQFSVIENATRTGFIYQCVYKGIDCNKERCLYLSKIKAIFKLLF